MDCRICGLSNPPYAEDCEFCAAAVQPRAEAERHRREWEALGETSKKEFVQTYRRDRERYEAWIGKLRSDRKRHAVLGAVGYGLGTNVLLAQAVDGGMRAFRP